MKKGILQYRLKHLELINISCHPIDSIKIGYNFLKSLFKFLFIYRTLYYLK